MSERQALSKIDTPEVKLSALYSKKKDITDFLVNIGDFLSSDIKLDQADLVVVSRALGKGYAQMLLELDPSEKKKLFNVVDFVNEKYPNNSMLLQVAEIINQGMQSTYESRVTVIDPTVRLVGGKITEVIRLPNYSK